MTNFIKLILFASVFLNTSTSHADDFLGDLNLESSEISEPIKKKSDSELLIKESAPSNNFEQKKFNFHFQIAAGPALNKYSLDSSTYSVDVPQQTGITYGAKFGFEKFNQSWGLALEYFETRYGIENLTGFTPSTANYKRSMYSLEFYKGVSDLNNNLKLHFGYYLGSNTIITTTPKAVIPDTSSHGVILGSSYKLFFSKVIDVSPRLSLYLPVSYRENTPATGNRTLSTLFSASVPVSFQLINLFSIGIEPKLFYQINLFDGLGSRGSNNATEKYFEFSVPFVLRLSL